MSFSILSLATSSPSAGKGEPRPRVIDIERDSAKLCNLPLGADISINNTSTLGREALVAALSKIGIDQSQIGMVIGDNCAPHQTTPSEAQRVAGKFDLRVPAFDISVGGCALLAMLESLSHMRTDALPDYIALVSSNSPTLRLHSKASSVELCVSDGSGVAIVSPRITSPIRIVEAHYGPSHLSHRLDTNGPGITIETAGFLTICEEFPGVVKEIVRRQTAAALEKCVMPLDRVKFIGGCFTDSDNLEIAESLRISSSNVLPGVESHGYSFGSLPFMILNSAWSELKQGDTLVISLAGAAYDAGFLILQVMEESMSLHILGMGYSHPKNIIDNKFLEDLDVGTNEQWILEKIGIVTRVTTLPLDYIRSTRNQDPREAVKVASMTPTDLGSDAARMALEIAGIKPEQVGLVL